METKREKIQNEINSINRRHFADTGITLNMYRANDGLVIDGIVHTPGDQTSTFVLGHQLSVKEAGQIVMAVNHFLCAQEFRKKSLAQM